ncbi:hypothetical protein WJ32_13580 [Burkholderia ubonensis]|uniref:Uncharacterized protein n=1 Tax=Burkholderia ubonensis TaxID=101571 RepID=A0A118HKM3_9BURK|nr:hypothetical protein WJ32_13580 [Burkholderia ubonensis]KVG54873.1 hypothetical protein WJ33_00970 [Burkholderia ubonensis]
MKPMMRAELQFLLQRFRPYTPLTPNLEKAQSPPIFENGRVREAEQVRGFLQAKCTRRRHCMRLGRADVRRRFRAHSSGMSFRCRLSLQ